MQVDISLDDHIHTGEALEIYTANQCSSAEQPQALMAAPRSLHCAVTARYARKLVGVGNVICDDFLVVYYPHMRVHPGTRAKV
jgi:hypothetical protein